MAVDWEKLNEGRVASTSWLDDESWVSMRCAWTSMTWTSAKDGRALAL